MTNTSQSQVVEDICAFRTTRPSAENAQSLLQDLLSTSSRSGLSSENMTKLVTLLTRKNKLGSSFETKLINGCLYPSDKVSNQVVYAVVGCLGHNDVPIQTQRKLLRWLVMVSPYLEDRAVLKQLYDILFINLRYELTRQWVCHLLYMATTKQFVKPWRVRYLLELFEANKDSQHLAALLVLYRDLNPSLVVISDQQLPAIRPLVFAHPDQRALEKLKQIHNDTTSLSDIRLKKSRNDIPEIRSMGDSGAETIRTLEEFAQNVHKLEFPMQMGSVLNDNSGMLVKLLRYRANEESWERLDTWLSNSIDDRILDKCCDFRQQIKHFPDAAQQHLFQRLRAARAAPGSAPASSLAALNYLKELNECNPSELLEILESLWADMSAKWRVACIRSLGQLSWRSDRIDQFVSEKGEKMMSDEQSVQVEDVLLEYFENRQHYGSRVPDRLSSILCESSLPSSVARLTQLQSNSVSIVKPHLESKSMKYIRKVEGNQMFGLDARHPHEPVTAQTLERLKQTGGVQITFDEYLQGFTKYIQDPTSFF